MLSVIMFNVVMLSVVAPYGRVFLDVHLANICAFNAATLCTTTQGRMTISKMTQQKDSRQNDTADGCKNLTA